LSANIFYFISQLLFFNSGISRFFVIIDDLKSFISLLIDIIQNIAYFR